MRTSDHAEGRAGTSLWAMPIVPETYERYPLTDQEKEALRRYLAARIASKQRVFDESLGVKRAAP